MKKNSILFFLFIWIGLPVWAQYKTLKDISYVPVSDTDAYRKERCKLDLYYPEQQKGFAMIVWFHGGGLEGGGKEIPPVFQGRKIAVAGVNYRLSPRATHPAYIDDAAAAVAWVMKHIGEYGGDTPSLYTAGFSGIFSIAPGPVTLEKSMHPEFAATHLQRLITQICKLLQAFRV